MESFLSVITAQCTLSEMDLEASARTQCFSLQLINYGSIGVRPYASMCLVGLTEKSPGSHSRRFFLVLSF